MVLWIGIGGVKCMHQDMPANQTDVPMISPVFAFHSCHVGMMWHDVIGVCIVGMPCHHGLHHMGMMYDRILTYGTLLDVLW